MLVQLRDVRANERLQEIGRRWVALSDDEKRHWNRRKDAMWVQYRKDLAKFKKVRHVPCHYYYYYYYYYIYLMAFFPGQPE